MLTRSIQRAFSSDFAHKQVSNGFSRKYGERFDKIFGKKDGQVKKDSSNKSQSSSTQPTNNSK